MDLMSVLMSNLDLRRRTVALAVGLALVAALLLGMGQAAAETVYPISAVLVGEHADVVRPVMARARQEVEAVVAAVKAQGQPVSLAMTAAYGSWFLPLVRVGGDLDFLGVIHLGKLPEGPDVRTASEAAIARIEAVLAGFYARRKAATDPSMALLAVEGLGDDGKLHNRGRALELVDAVIGQVAQGRGVDTAFPYKGRQAPYHFDPRLVSITVHPRAKYLSNRFNLEPKQTAHVREVSVQFFFVAEQGQRTVILQPLYARAASPIRLWRFVFETAFASPAERDQFAALAEPGFDLGVRRPNYGAFMLQIGGLEISGKRPIKAAKRLLQSFLMIEPALPEKTRRTFRQEVGGWLTSTAAALDDLAAVTHIHAKAAKVGAVAAFHASGDARRVLDGYAARMGAAAKAGQAGAADLESLLPLIDAVRPSDGKTEAARWDTVAAKAAELARKLGPPKNRLEHWQTVLGKAYHGAGCRMVPIAGLKEDRVVVPARGLTALGLDAKMLPAWPGGAYRFDVQPSDAWTQLLGAQPSDGPVRHFFIRQSATTVEQAGWQAMQRALAESNQRFFIGRKRQLDGP